jgi:hypothetical protein
MNINGEIGSNNLNRNNITLKPNLNSNNTNTNLSSNLYFLDENFKITNKKANFQKASLNDQAKTLNTLNRDENKINGVGGNVLGNHSNSFRLPQVKSIDSKFKNLF